MFNRKVSPALLSALDRINQTLTRQADQQAMTAFNLARIAKSLESINAHIQTADYVA